MRALVVDDTDEKGSATDDVRFEVGLLAELGVLPKKALVEADSGVRLSATIRMIQGNSGRTPSAPQYGASAAVARTHAFRALQGVDLQV
jgi:hypothetical protein